MLLCVSFCTFHLTHVSLPQSKARDFSAWRINRGSVPRCSRRGQCSPSDMFDKTRTGRIDVFGFSALWDFMQRWRALFQQYDRDHSGSISAVELQQGMSRHVTVDCCVLTVQTPLPPLCLPSSALAHMGYNLSPQFSQTLVQRFSVRGGRPGMQLDRFIQVCTQLQSTTQFFRERDTAMSGNIRVSYEDFLSGAITRLMWAALRGQSVLPCACWVLQFSTMKCSSKVSRTGRILQYRPGWFNNNGTMLIWTEFQG